MKKQDIEFRVLDIIDRLEKGQPIEDDMVELKTEWPVDHFKAARRIAAHANCARGEAIMWIIGIDEKNGVVGADFEELSIWYAKIKSQFDQFMAPNLISLAVPYNGKTVVALVFETERAPFVIRIPAIMGPVTYEVPWREANSTRSARRSDLLKLLYPIQKQPSVEILDGKIELQKSLSGSGLGAYQLNLNLMLYFITNSSETMVFPFHRCEVLWRPLGRPEEKRFTNLKIAPPTSYSSRDFVHKNKSLTVDSTDYEVLIDTAGMTELTADCFQEEKQGSIFFEPIELKVKLCSHHSDLPVTLEAEFALVQKQKEPSDRLLGRWEIVNKTTPTK